MIYSVSEQVYLKRNVCLSVRFYKLRLSGAPVHSSWASLLRLEVTMLGKQRWETEVQPVEKGSGRALLLRVVSDPQRRLQAGTSHGSPQRKN